MNGNRYLLDTNAIVALFNGNMSINNLLVDANWIGVSIIAVVEYLSFTNLSIEDKQLLDTLLQRIEVIDLTINDFDFLIKVSEIRIEHKLKLPDSIIAATSIVNNASLITADKGFDKVKELTVIGFN